jgi:type I restriction enzyme R subunit
MSYAKPDSENAAIEQPAIALFGRLRSETLNCYQENFGPLSPLGRDTKADVISPNRLRSAIERRNPGISANAIKIATRS